MTGREHPTIEGIANQALTPDERETFESLADAYEGEPLGDVFKSALRKDDEIKRRNS